MVLPAAKQGCRERWFSREDRAIAALEAIATPHLPASLAQLEAAVAEANANYERTCAQAREAAAVAAAAAKPKKPASARRRRSRRKPSPRRRRETPPRSSAGRLRHRGPGSPVGGSPCATSCARARPASRVEPGPRWRVKAARQARPGVARVAFRGPRARTVASLEITLFLCPFPEPPVFAPDTRLFRVRSKQ